MIKWLFAIGGIWMIASSFCPAETFLTREGKPVGEIFISDQDETGSGIRFRNSNVAEAAAKLSHAIQKISGAELPIRRIGKSDLKLEIANLKTKGKTPILLGALALELVGGPSESQKNALSDPCGFILRVSENSVAIAGATPRGTEIGIDELLEQIGIRWFFPGEWGTVTPQIKTIKLPDQDVAQKPTFASRYFGMNALDQDPVIADWQKHQREGGPFLPPAHGIPLGDDVKPETNPDLYAKTKHPNHIPQLCLSNPEVLSRAIEQTRKYFRENPNSPWIGMGPADGSGFCECEKCRALDGGDWDPFSNEPVVTDRYIWFFNKILDGIKDEFPDKKIAFYIYHCYIEPPVKVTPNPKIVGALAPIGLCRIHGINNPVCPERSFLKKIVSEWTKIIPEVYERGYWFNLADPGMLFIQVHRIRDEIPFYAKQGIRGFRTECTNQWAVHGPSLYIAGKLMWNSNADVDVLMRDFCEKFFGPAAAPMQQFFGYLDKRMRDADHHAGSAFDLLEFYPPDARKQITAYIKDAQKLATTLPYSERIDVFAKAAAYNDSFCQMIEARNAQKWADARAALRKMDALREELLHHDPPLLSQSQSENYLRRFFRLAVEQGDMRSSGGNTLVAPLRDEWLSLNDPQNVGEDLHYERPEITGGNWQRTPTYSTTWSDRGMRYYKGFAWYRQTVEIPKSFVGKRIFLWFGGVDESARVWVNGKLAGTSPSSAFTPFELDVTRLLEPGKNLVVLCVANLRTNELGIGGITAPAFFYAPKDGDAAVLENIKPLRDTFP